MTTSVLLRTPLAKGIRVAYQFIGIRSYHPDALSVPEVPISMHDPNYNFIITEDGSPLKYLEPEIPKFDRNTLNKYSQMAVQNVAKLKEKYLQSRGDFDIILFSNAAIQTAREIPNKFSNYLLSNGGVISFEKIAPIERLKSNVKDAGTKLTGLSGKLPIATIQEKWELVKEKMPAWQNTIATKLQTFQDTINKRLNPKKAE